MRKKPERNSPMVSIIMPAYNGEGYLAEAIQSVLNQTWHDWELIVINDGSTDNTREILTHFTDERIIILHQDNSGESRSRNRGLAAARGDYIGFLDADDIYLPDALADMVAYLNHHPEADTVYADGYFCDELAQPIMKLSAHRPGPYTGNILEPLVITPSVISGIICTMTRRKTLDAADVRFDPDLTIGPDWDFWIHLARHARFGYLDTAVCMYRVHQSNITRTTGKEIRRNDHLRGRLKVMRSDWFEYLSLPTRRQFFCDMLLNLLSGNAVGQDTIVESEPFLALPGHDQADLLRLVATDYLLRHDDWELFYCFLERALLTDDRNRKSQLLQILSRLGPPLTSVALNAWATLVRGSRNLLAPKAKRRRPVPAALSPYDA